MYLKILSPFAIAIAGLLASGFAAFVSWNRESQWLFRVCLMLVLLELVLIYPASQLDKFTMEPGLLELLNALTALAGLVVLFIAVAF